MILHSGTHALLSSVPVLVHRLVHVVTLLIVIVVVSKLVALGIELSATLITGVRSHTIVEVPSHSIVLVLVAASASFIAHLSWTMLLIHILLPHLVGIVASTRHAPLELLLWPIHSLSLAIATTPTKVLLLLAKLRLVTILILETSRASSLMLLLHIGDLRCYRFNFNI